jgi:hypothetical protein
MAETTPQGRPLVRREANKSQRFKEKLKLGKSEMAERAFHDPVSPPARIGMKIREKPTKSEKPGQEFFPTRQNVIGQAVLRLR